MQEDNQNTTINHQDGTNGAAVAVDTAAAATTPIDEIGAADNIAIEAVEPAAAAEKENKESFDLPADQYTGTETEKTKKERFDFRRRGLLKELEQKEKEFDKLRDEYAKLVLQHADLKDRHLRLAAEMDNFRKRLEREFLNRVESRMADLLAELLPVADDFERFFGVSGEAKDYDSLAAGARLIYQNVLKILQNRGVAAMETVGQEFDPNRHEALLQMPVEGKAPNLVVQETAKGYLLLDKVLRPAKVIVSV
jgi:molecular chaperone GrpE